MKQPLLCLVGPTAVGKTDLSLDLAEQLQAEIVSVDSMQVYRHMNIGTGKVPLSERRGIQHHMIDVAEPTHPFTVHEFAEQARPLLQAIYARGKLPLLVGGTGLYVRALVDQYDFAQTDRDPVLRAQLEQEVDAEGAHILHARLQEQDPESAARIHPHDARRIIRALEIVQTTGGTVKNSSARAESPYHPVMIGLTCERDTLYSRIGQRIDHMVEQGLVREVEDLLALGCNEQHTAMQAIGYKEILEYLRGACTLQESIDTMKQASRRYAKRQWSWFRADKRLVWYERTEDGMMRDVVLNYIQTALQLGQGIRMGGQS